MKTITLANGDLVTIKQKPWWLFWLGKYYTITLSPYVYTPDTTYENEDMDVLVHENIHLHQQSDMGKWKFYFNYVFSREFRYQSEFSAYTTQLKWYVDSGTRVNMPSQIDVIGNMLSSANYLWCVSKERSVKEMTDMMVAYGGYDQ